MNDARMVRNLILRSFHEYIGSLFDEDRKALAHLVLSMDMLVQEDVDFAVSREETLAEVTLQL